MTVQQEAVPTALTPPATALFPLYALIHQEHTLPPPQFFSLCQPLQSSRLTWSSPALISTTAPPAPLVTHLHLKPVTRNFSLP